MFSLQAVFIKVTAGFPPRHTHSSKVTGSCESLSREGFMGGVCFPGEISAWTYTVQWRIELII